MLSSARFRFYSSLHSCVKRLKFRHKASIINQLIFYRRLLHQPFKLIPSKFEIPQYSSYESITYLAFLAAFCYKKDDGKKII